MIDPIQSDTVQSQPTAVSTAAGGAPSPVSSGPSTSTNVAALTSASNATKPADAQSSPSAAQGQAPGSASGSGSGGASDAQSSADAAPPLRLLIEHDKTTNQYVYKLYDSSGRIVREIPQESLAEAQKQAGGTLGAVIDTKV